MRLLREKKAWPRLLILPLLFCLLIPLSMIDRTRASRLRFDGRAAAVPRPSAPPSPHPLPTRVQTDRQTNKQTQSIRSFVARLVSRFDLGPFRAPVIPTPPPAAPSIMCSPPRPHPHF